MPDPGDPVFIIKYIRGSLMMDSLPRYKFDNGNKEKRTIVTGLSFQVAVELFNYDEGLPDIGDAPDLESDQYAIEHVAFWGETVLRYWFTQDWDYSVDGVMSNTFYEAVPTAVGDDTDPNGDLWPPENTEYLKEYGYPLLDASYGTGDEEEGVDYVSVPNYGWQFSHARSKEDYSLGKTRRYVILTGKHSHLRKQTEIEVDL